MKYFFVILMICFTFELSALEAQAPKPLSEKKIECNGVLHGKEFWLRLLPAKKEYANMRILELLYTPPDVKALDGCHLIDHPQILLNDNLGIVAWKEGRGSHQSGLSGAIYQAQKKQYDVAREVNDEQGEVAMQNRQIATEQACWDLHLLPLLTSLTKLDANFQIGVCDLYGSKHESLLELSYDKSGSLKVGKTTYKVTYDDKGQLKEIRNAKNELIIRVDAWR